MGQSIFKAIKRILGLLIVTTVFCSSSTIEETFITISDSKQSGFREDFVLEKNKSNFIESSRYCWPIETNFTSKESQIEPRTSDICDFNIYQKEKK